MQVVGIVASLAMGAIGASREKEAYDKAADEQREMARRNAQREEAEAQEAVRVAEDEKRRTVALAKAGAAASGTTLGGTQAGYVGELEKTEQAKIDWLKKSGKSRSDITLASGEMAAQTSEAQGSAAWWGGIGGGVSSALSFL